MVVQFRRIYRIPFLGFPVLQYRERLDICIQYHDMFIVDIIYFIFRLRMVNRIFLIYRAKRPHQIRRFSALEGKNNTNAMLF